MSDARTLPRTAALLLVASMLLLLTKATLSPVEAVAAPNPAQVTSVETGTESPPPSALFSDDFEAFGDSSRWARNYPFTVQPRAGSNNSFAAHLRSLPGHPAFGRKTLDAPVSSLYVRIRFQADDVEASAITLLALRSSAREGIVEFTLSPTGQIGWTTSATNVSATSELSTSLNTWHELQIFVDTSTTVNNIRVWVDGAELSTLKQDAFVESTPIRIVQIGDNSAGRSADLYVDDVIASNNFIDASQLADPVPGTLLVRTVPSQAGLQFVLDGETFTSDSEGVARIKVAAWSTTLRSRISVPEHVDPDGSTLSFMAWKFWVNAQTREVVAAFDISRPISLQFTDSEGKAVDSSRIDEVVLKSSTGVIHELSSTELASALLPVASIANTPAGLQEKPILYVVDQVIIDGANVVHRSQQKTTFENTSSWTISLLFFDVRFVSKDALFGSAIGSHVLLTAADGTQYSYPLDAKGQVLISRIPRGEYQVEVVGAGYAPPRPILISRTQTIELEGISHLDMLLFAALIGGTVIALVLIGRPFLVTTPVRWATSVVQGTARHAQKRFAK